LSNQTHGKTARPDKTLSDNCRVWTWAIPYNNQKPFGHFRILQTGPTSNNRHLLSCSGFELYGRLLNPHVDPTTVDETAETSASSALSAAAEARDARIEALEDR
jgi:hypothetical protein